MKKTMIKSLITIVFIVIIFVAIARFIGKSETVSDYAAKKERVKPEIEVVEEPSDKNNDQVSSDRPGPDIKEDETEADTAADMEGEKNSSDEGDVNADSAAQADTDDSANDDLTKGSMVEVSAADAFYIEEISEELREQMRGKSYADNIDETRVNFDMLRHVVILYNNADSETVKGELVCNKAIAQDLLEIFEELYKAGYQFEEVALIDKYNADDTVSMEHNNTSCFNYRVVDDSTRLSNHAYGRAIDVNPFYNPYITFNKDGSAHVSPQGAEAYADRTADFQYKIDENDLAFKLFIAHGFKWGGYWNSCKDYQHFEKKE